MDEMIKESLAGFDGVWQRVTGREAAPTTGPGIYDEEDVLLRLIHQEACAVVYAGSLAKMLQGDGRALLLRHAAEAKRHLRRLRAEYFIATGVADGGNEDCRSVAGKLASLRTAFLQAEELAAQYDAAAAHTSCPALREVFTAFADETRRRAKETRSLLIENF